MKCIKRFSFIIIMATLVLASCQKEHSIENGAGIKDTIADDCTIQQLLEADSASGIVNYAFVSVYNSDTANTVSEIRFVDSSRNRVDNTYPVIRTGNRVQVNAVEYFLTGTDGRVAEFHGYENLLGIRFDKIVARYTYNAAGLLVKRVTEYDSIPGVTQYQIDYTYSGNNLIKSDLKLPAGPTLQSVGSVTFEYDASKTVKNFLYLQGFSPQGFPSEIFTFQTAVNFGTGATNPVSKATFSYLDITTGSTITYASRFINYTIDANHYVQSFYVTGDDFFIGNLYSGFKYVLKYHCI